MSEIKEENHVQFLNFMMSNYDYDHDCWKMNKDLTLKLKEEDSRELFNQSKNNLSTFAKMMKNPSSHKKNKSVNKMNLNSPSAETINYSGGDGRQSNIYALTQAPFVPAMKIHEVDSSEGESDATNESEKE